MPSIPQSLLWISLVVLWLFVLVPMLVSKRDAVRRTSDVALATRVLNGGANSRLIKRSGPAAGHRSDPNWTPPEESAETELDEERDLAEDEDEEHGDDHDTEELRELRPVVMKVAAPERTEPDYLDVDVVEDSQALPAGAAVEDEAEADEDDDSDTDVVAHGAATRTTRATNTSRTLLVWNPKPKPMTRKCRRRSHGTPRGVAGSTRRPPPRSAPASTNSASAC